MAVAMSSYCFMGWTFRCNLDAQKLIKGTSNNRIGNSETNGAEINIGKIARSIDRHDV